MATENCRQNLGQLRFAAVHVEAEVCAPVAAASRSKTKIAVMDWFLRITCEISGRPYNNDCEVN
jgi:hypothetical protein